jgi:hypothetical protein
VCCALCTGNYFCGYDVTNDTKLFYNLHSQRDDHPYRTNIVRIMQQVIAVDQIKVFLTVKPVDWSHFARYTLTASNVVSMTSVGLELIEDPTYNGSYVPTTSKSYAHTEESTIPQDEDVREDEVDDLSDDDDDEEEEEDDDDEEDESDEWFVESSNETILEDTFTLGEFTVQPI